jgi:enoyl-CoA hydratase
MDTVSLERRGGELRITLNRPDVMNAWDKQFGVDLRAAVEQAAADDEVRAVVITGAGRAFSSGADLRAGFDATPEGHPDVGSALRDRYHPIITSVRRMPKPVLAAVNGPAVGIGCSLALACDLIVAREGVRFGTPEINVGLFPFMIMALIYRNVPRKKTTELLLLGERIDAREAERIGIVNKVVPAGELDTAVRDWATRLAAKSPVLMRMGKDAIYRQMDMAFEDALDYLRSQLTIAFSTEDIQEGVNAFFEKREPKWKGR